MLSSGSCEGIVIESNEGSQSRHALELAFPSSNNVAEYKALIAGLLLIGELGG
jgi:ribonuclease HI